MKVIGIIGRMGSGKTEVSEYLRRRYGTPVVAIGDIVREIADVEGLPPTRTNLNDLSKRYAEQYGPDFFARRVLDKAEEIPDPAFAVAGVRTPADVATFRTLLGDDFVLVHVDVTAATTRFERLRQRACEQDPQTYDAFLRMDDEEERRFSLGEAIRQADRTLQNDGALGDLYEQVEQVIVQSLLARAPAS